ncbi:hypothetical protein [Photobacterium leiognathi]|uniref:hypothetical protein n=1 Tax=Photobacterium leiognathi TaxID=553611 RepID=UPI00298246E8|nr:hypothetical protein [Photobacterium leiognathi]
MKTYLIRPTIAIVDNNNKYDVKNLTDRTEQISFGQCNSISTSSTVLDELKNNALTITTNRRSKSLNVEFIAHSDLNAIIIAKLLKRKITSKTNGLYIELIEYSQHITPSSVKFCFIAIGAELIQKRRHIKLRRTPGNNWVYKIEFKLIEPANTQMVGNDFKVKECVSTKTEQ